jgi:drug/metabolite transporter (DMT)-like permease
MPFTWVVPTSGQWILMFFIGLCASLKYADASKLAPFSYFEIITNVSIGYYFFSDFPDFWTWIGLAIIVLSGVYISFRERFISS